MLLLFTPSARVVMFGRRETARIPIGTRRIEAYRAGMDTHRGAVCGQGWADPVLPRRHGPNSALGF
jgi:hypothetical protein